METFTYLRHVCLVENITALQLQIVRDKGLLGDIAIQLVAKPNFLLHINNQATENEDYVLQEAMIIMKENMKETYVKVAILPVSLNGNPLQCSCLENPRDGGAWRAAVYGVAQSRTRLKRLSSSSGS